MFRQLYTSHWTQKLVDPGTGTSVLTTISHTLTHHHQQQHHNTNILSAAILANLLLGSESADELSDSYGAPVETYGAPVETYGAPVESYDAPVEQEIDQYGVPEAAPAASYTPVDTYGSPAAEALPSYNAPAYQRF